MRARSFFYVCAGMLMFAIAYQLGASKAEAQLGGDFTGIHVNRTDRMTTVVTATGDVYARPAYPLCNSSSGMFWAEQGGCEGIPWTFMATSSAAPSPSNPPRWAR